MHANATGRDLTQEAISGEVNITRFDNVDQLKIERRDQHTEREVQLCVSKTVPGMLVSQTSSKDEHVKRAILT